jgi:hypothetical protein
VAFETDVADLMPGKHSRISRSVRFMAGAAAIETHGSMFKGEWAPLIDVTLQATGFVGRYAARLTRGDQRAVRVVTIDTRHRSLREPVGMRPVELNRGVRVTTRALLIHVGRFARDQRDGGLMDTVALYAAYLTVRMPGADTP